MIHENITLAFNEVSITFCLETERKGNKQNESFKKPGNFRYAYT